MIVAGTGTVRDRRVCRVLNRVLDAEYQFDLESVGLRTNALVLGKHLGRHAFKKRLEKMGCELDDEQLNKAFVWFKTLADLIVHQTLPC